MIIGDKTITSLETITAFKLTGEYWFTLDELQNATIANTEEKVDITGKGGRRISSLKRNKSVTISGANGLVSGGLLELQTGGTFEKKDTEILWKDYLGVDGSNQAKTLFKAVGTEGAEIEALYIRNADGTEGEQLEQNSGADVGKFTYDPDSKVLQFHTDVTEGTEIIVYYKRKINAETLDNYSDNYSGKCMLYIDAMAEDKCGNIFRIQFYVPKADFSGEFSIELGENQTVHSFEAESLAGACGALGSSSLLWTYTVFGEGTKDAIIRGADAVAVPDQSKDMGTFGKVSELIDTNVKIDWKDINGTVTGTIKNKKDYSAFSSDPSEQNGHFFPVVLDKYEGKPITCIATKEKTANDNEWIVRLDEVMKTTKKVIFKAEDQEIAVLDFSTATMQQDG